MKNNIEILKNKLIEKLNHKKEYNRTIILEEREEGERIFITQFTPLKVYKGNDLYAAIHVQSIEIDPSYPNTIYFYQYTNKIEENEKKTFGFNTPTFENGWSRSISSIKGKMKVRERLEKGEILTKDTFSKLKPLVVNWDNDFKPNTRKKETTMYKIHWLEAGEGIHYLFKEVLDYRYDGRIIVDNTEDLEDIKDFLLDDEEYEYLGVSQNFLFVDFLELLKEDKKVLNIVRLLSGEDVSDLTNEEEKVDATESTESSKPQEEKFKNISKISSSTFTKFMDKLLDCEVEIPEDELKFLLKFVMEYYLGDNLKFIINKLTQE